MDQAADGHDLLRSASDSTQKTELRKSERHDDFDSL
jgi:hypothetical protein